MTSLIAQLNEASDLPLAQLKALMKKDKRVNVVFTKSPQLDEIDDPVEFVKTMRYYLLNNRNVLDFVKMRGPASQRISSWGLKSVREIKPGFLTQNGLNDIAEFVSDVFRDLTTVTNVTITSDTLHSLWGWLDKSAGYRGDFPYSAARELATIPTVRPSQPVRLYRGLSFSERGMQEKPEGSTMSVGEGLRLLRSIRKGKRVVDAEWEHATMWTRDKEKARKDAFSENSWQQDKETISGKLGVVLSVLAKPSDIIADTDMLGPKTVKRDPPMVVLKGGKHTARVVHMWNPDGEVDPTKDADEASDAVAVVESLTMFAHVFKLPFPEPAFESVDRGAWTPEKKQSFIELSQPEAAAKIIKAYDLLRAYYAEHVQSVTEDELNLLAADSRYSRAVVTAKMMRDVMEAKVAHPTELDPRYSAHLKRAKYYQRVELSGKDTWDGDRVVSIRDVIPFIASKKRFTDWNTGASVNNLVRMGGGSTFDKLHLRAAALQQSELTKGIKAFFDTIGKPVPESSEDIARQMVQVVKTAERNAKMLGTLWNIRSSLDTLKD